MYDRASGACTTRHINWPSHRRATQLAKWDHTANFVDAIGNATYDRREQSLVDEVEVASQVHEGLEDNSKHLGTPMCPIRNRWGYSLACRPLLAAYKRQHRGSVGVDCPPGPMMHVIRELALDLNEPVLRQLRALKEPMQSETNIAPNQ